MGTPTQVYVNPALNSNTGTGTIGDPFGDTQFALDSTVRDAVNGNQFNIKSGASEIMAAALNLATYGASTATAPLIIRGYTAAANDGGIGVLDGNNSVAIINTTNDSIKIVDMRLTNTGANVVCTIDTNALLLNCEIDTSTGGGATFSGGSHIINCFFHNLGVIGARLIGAGFIGFNTFRNETNDFSQAIQSVSNSTIAFNLIDIDGASHGINIVGSGITILFNSIFSNGGTGSGIRNPTTTDIGNIIINNTVQGFSGAGGRGIHVAGQNAEVVGFNLAFNNTTNFDYTGDIDVALGSNDVAAASPFVNAGGDDFDPISGLLALYPSYPTTWKNYTSTQQNLIRMAAQYSEAVVSVPGGSHILGGFVVR